MTPDLMKQGAQRAAAHAPAKNPSNATESGGRGSLIGPVVGAFLVNGAKSWLTVTAPEFWLYFLGALFIAVTLFLPQGVVGLVQRLKGGRS